MLPSYRRTHWGARHGAPKIGMVGYQPASDRRAGGSFEMRVLDLDLDNIGQTRHGAPAIEGEDATDDETGLARCSSPVTGTTLANGTIDMFLAGSGHLLRHNHRRSGKHHGAGTDFARGMYTITYHSLWPHRVTGIAPHKNRRIWGSYRHTKEIHMRRFLPAFLFPLSSGHSTRGKRHTAQNH